MATVNEMALSAIQGQDTQDLLNHIAWTDIIKPKLIEAKLFYTNQLVDALLSKHEGESKEQIAGKIYGIDYVVKVLERILKEGSQSREALASLNLHLQ